MHKLFFIALAGFVLSGLVLAQDSLLNTVQDRGTLICGVNNQVPGFGNVDAQGEYSGFDVDTCRAIAAAVLGDANAVDFRPLSAQERFTAVQTGEVDVLARNTTWTSTRDSSVGLDFAPTTFYDGQGFMVRSDAGISELTDLEGRSICVQSGTTTELNLADVMQALDVQYNPVIFETADQAVAAYDEGVCDAYTTDVSGLVSRRTTLREPDASVILDRTISKEPLAPAVLQGDTAWRDAVEWVIFGLFNAEEYGVTSENAQQMADESQDPNVRRLLGVEGDAVSALGLPADAILQAVSQVGNYGEIYNRNLGPDTPFNIERGLNEQYYNGGLIYGVPFR